MVTHDITKLKYPHNFDRDNRTHERKTWIVIIITALMMIAEITAGIYYGSLALLADGIHMGTHAAALGITIFAYIYARKHSNDQLFTFGTGKVGVLGGYTSAICLGIAALFMIGESIQRFLSPVTIHFGEAIGVAVIGLLVNIICAVFLDDHDHDNDHHHHHDHNLKAAYIHIISDAVTSVFAIIALLGGWILGLHWLDPLMGIVGAVVIGVWALSLLKDTAKILTDSGADQEYLGQIQKAIESDNDNIVVDLHIWKIDSDNYSVLIALLTHRPQEIAHYRGLLSEFPEIKHAAFEINICTDKACLSQQPV